MNNRMIQECMKKLNSEFIYSKQYSDLSKPFIVTLFTGKLIINRQNYKYFYIELANGNFENASALASNILASFFIETKEWILPLKRLIEFAKIQK